MKRLLRIAGKAKQKLISAFSFQLSAFDLDTIGDPDFTGKPSPSRRGKRGQRFMRVVQGCENFMVLPQFARLRGRSFGASTPGFRQTRMEHRGSKVAKSLPLNLQVGRVTPCAPFQQLSSPGAHGVTRPTTLPGFKGSMRGIPFRRNLSWRPVYLFLQKSLPVEPFGEALDPVVAGKVLFSHTEPVAAPGEEVKFG